MLKIVISSDEFFYEDRRTLEIERIIIAGQALLEKGDLVVTTNRERETLNIADELSLKEAIRMAIELAPEK